ncbi:hypothetical protein BD779DRAFT_1508087 [Infundibulicybe gibba]|nr:hypothetical protein BD779DRAFT_1508087 [Infundibulicybe gibba]
MAGFPLDHDTTDRVFTFIPTLTSLLSMARTSRSMYSTFKIRSSSLLSAVAHNDVGPAWPQALLLAQYQSSPSLSAPNCKLTHDEIRILSRNAKVVRDLEDIFSWRHKDRTKRVSQLSYEESWRFHRAIYRIWLVSFICGDQSISPLKQYKPMRGRPPSENQLKQEEILRIFSSSELLQLRRAAVFLQSLLGWVLGAQGKLCSTSIVDSCLFAGPSVILKCHKDISMNAFPFEQLAKEDVPFRGFIWQPLKNVLEDRGEARQSSKAFEKTILDDVVGTNDKCEHCHSVNQAVVGIKQGVNLWNETNWDYLQGKLILDIHFRIPGNLSRNETESALRETLVNIDRSTLLHEIFASRRAKYHSWTKKQWVCFDCLALFIEATLPFWWLDRKMKGRVGGGFDCARQVSRDGWNHAQDYNHLCVPWQK